MAQRCAFGAPSPPLLWCPSFFHFPLRAGLPVSAGGRVRGRRRRAGGAAVGRAWPRRAIDGGALAPAADRKWGGAAHVGGVAAGRYHGRRRGRGGGSAGHHCLLLLAVPVRVFFCERGRHGRGASSTSLTSTKQTPSTSMNSGMHALLGCRDPRVEWMQHTTPARALHVSLVLQHMRCGLQELVVNRGRGHPHHRPSARHQLLVPALISLPVARRWVLRRPFASLFPSPA